MENQTLTFILTLVAAISSLALLINWAGNRHIPGLVNIATGFVISATGTILLSQQGGIDPLLSVLLAYALVFGGRTAVVSGLAQFWNQEKSRLPLLCVLLSLGTLGVSAYFTLSVDDPVWRIRSYTLMMVIFSLCNIVVILNGLRLERKLRPAMSVSSNFGAFLALMLFGFNTVTEFMLMLVRTGELLDQPGDGTSLLLLVSIFTMVIFAFAIVIMTKEELAVEHKEDSIFDPITTILNQRTFLEVGQRIVGVALRYSKPVSMLNIEVQNMDAIVKEHGYKVGNEMLRHFSLMAIDRRRNEDVLARSGLNQFRMLLPGVDEEGAKVVIGKIRATLQGEDFVYRGKKLEADVLIAAITCREEDLDLQQMLQAGEVELYRLKYEQQTA